MTVHLHDLVQALDFDQISFYEGDSYSKSITVSPYKIHYILQSI